MLARRAVMEDSGALARLNEEFNGVYRLPSQIREHLATQGEFVVVVCSEEDVVGFACAQVTSSFCYEEKQGEITELFVEEGYRRRGAAKLMLALLEDILKGEEVGEIRLATDKDNVPAWHLYQELGYAKEDVLLAKRLR